MTIKLNSTVLMTGKTHLDKILCKVVNTKEEFHRDIYVDVFILKVIANKYINLYGGIKKNSLVGMTYKFWDEMVECSINDFNVRSVRREKSPIPQTGLLKVLESDQDNKLGIEVEIYRDAFVFVDVIFVLRKLSDDSWTISEFTTGRGIGINENTKREAKLLALIKLKEVGIEKLREKISEFKILNTIKEE